jgi:hypothetical protein
MGEELGSDLLRLILNCQLWTMRLDHFHAGNAVLAYYGECHTVRPREDTCGGTELKPLQSERTGEDALFLGSAILRKTRYCLTGWNFDGAQGPNHSPGTTAVGGYD